MKLMRSLTSRQKTKTEEALNDLETGLESMELRLLEAIWSLERSLLDQIEILNKIHMNTEVIKSALIARQSLSSTPSSY